MRLWQTSLLVVVAIGCRTLDAQAANRFLGTVTSVSGDTLTVKTEAGEVRQVKIPSSASLKRIAPGEKDLSNAATIQFGDLANGDRVLVKLDPDAPATAPQALQVIAIKQADVAQKQQKEREDWQRYGVGGLVKSVDGASGVIVLTTGAGTTAKTVTVHVGKNTVLKRYAPGSVRFGEAQAAPVDAIQTGDQLRARGQKNTDGTEINAEEVVSGSFRNISGTVNSIDTATSTVTVKDLITKKPVTIHIGSEAQMRRLPDMMARMIAARLKGAAPAGGANAVRSQGNGAVPQQGGGQDTGQFQGAGQGRAGGGDMQQVLNRAPAIQLGDLQKGEAVMVVSTQGATDVTAITLVAGVEPLLEAPAASQNLLANWSMGNSAEATAQ
jgi:hypothetical protein